MSLSSSLYTGVSGLQTAQNALNTVSHNLANADTKGYTRQQISLADRQYQQLDKRYDSISQKQSGIGVKYAKCKQVRDTFLDKSYRNENSKQQFYKICCDNVSEVENLFQELDGETFFQSLDNFWVSVQELSKDPESSITQNMFVSRAQQLITQSKEIYSGLEQYQKNLDIEIKTQVEQINSIGNRINILNKEISKIESAGVENANDLRDERNNLLDELSGYGKITYSEDKIGRVNVMFENNIFVSDSYVNNIETDYANEYGFTIPYWGKESEYHMENENKIIDSIEGCEVIKLNNINSNEFDKGSLKALMLQRGTHSATYKDLENQDYETKIAPSIMMNTQAQFDNLIHDIVTKINEVILNAPSNPGNFNNTPKENYLLFKDINNKEEFSIKNTCVNEILLQNPNILTFKTESGEADIETCNELNKIFSEENFVLNPTINMKMNLKDGYNALVSQIANFGNIYKNVLETQEKTVNAINDERLEITGVSTDEELAQMIQFQNMYNASSRYINVVNEMMDHIITRLA